MLSGLTASCLCLATSIAPNNFETAQKDREAAWLTQHPVIQEMMKLQNVERARYSLPPLTMNRDMCLAAQKHAEWMSRTGYYVHSNLPWPEIIHSGPTTAGGAVTGWIYSPSHHAIMLSGRTAGFGYAKRNGGTYWVTVIQ